MPDKVVTAALIVRDGKFLICQRSPHHSHPLKWEFAGGKLEPNEELRDCLRRELREELGIEAEIGPEVTRFFFSYPGRLPVLLVFFRVSRFSGELQNRIFADIRWVSREELPDFDFVEADRQLVARLARGQLLPGGEQKSGD